MIPLAPLASVLLAAGATGSMPQLSLDFEDFGLELTDMIGVIPLAPAALEPSERNGEAFVDYLRARESESLEETLARFRLRGNPCFQFMYVTQGEVQWFRGKAFPEDKHGAYNGELAGVRMQFVATLGTLGAVTRDVPVKFVVATSVTKDNVMDQRGSLLVFLEPEQGTVPWELIRSETSKERSGEAWYVFLGFPRDSLEAGGEIAGLVPQSGGRKP